MNKNLINYQKSSIAPLQSTQNPLISLQQKTSISYNRTLNFPHPDPAYILPTQIPFKIPVMPPSHNSTILSPHTTNDTFKRWPPVQTRPDSGYAVVVYDPRWTIAKIVYSTLLTPLYKSSVLSFCIDAMRNTCIRIDVRNTI